MTDHKAIALIPARAGSKRIPGKNIRLLAGHPLLAYSIAAARASGCFDSIVVSSEDDRTLDIAKDYGAIPLKRPAEMSTDTSLDIEWVTHALTECLGFDIYSILRPTAPFRTAETIQRAMIKFLGWQPADSIRAMEPVRQHPCKMWLIDGEKTFPYTGLSIADGEYNHSKPIQRLRRYWIQNASLEIAWADMTRRTGTISGEIVRPFLTIGNEGLDLNTENDWILAEALINKGLAKLQEVKR